MRTFISPIGYDTRRVTRPVVRTGLSSEDTVVMIRPESDSDPERATQSIADVEQLLQEIEPAASVAVERVSVEDFQTTIRECSNVVRAVPDRSEIVVSLGGGARDVLLPLTLVAVLHTERIDRTLFFSDLDQDVRPISMPNLTARIPARTRGTFDAIVAGDGWLTLSELATRTDQSKSTIIRHVQDLEAAGVATTDTSGKSKRVRATPSGEFLETAWTSGN